METSMDAGEARVEQRSPAGLGRFFAAEGAVDVPGLAAYLDGLDEEARVAATVSMTPRQQATLFEAARGFRPVTLDDFVPSAAEPRVTVRHAGKNSMGSLVSRFEKRFCRPEAGVDRLWGYNQNPGWLQPVTGPGYFVCYPIADGEVLIDYCQVPPSDAEQPAGWPRVRLNSAGLSRYIYNRTQDTMRGVSRHVTVGRAAREGKLLPNWFVLCRREASPAEPVTTE